MTTGTMWAYIIKYTSRYEKNSVKWCYKNKDELMRLGITSCDLIHRIFGV